MVGWAFIDCHGFSLICFFTLVVPLWYLGNEWVFFSILHVSGTPLVLGGGGGAFFKAAAFLYVCDIGRIEESGLV